ncbi:MAG: hypothetical protein KIT11_01400 [Fimbriimonadaceae bacterium]|nr:hypothetical protein [Fimbriimonadaceae bacterium]QYK54971.1 MAG: hypothetical protein KF733_08135 [Fimbriimonadaceae bacterium]
MPELPDVTLYVEKLKGLLTGQVVRDLKIVAINVLKSVEPPVSAVLGCKVLDVERLGKQVVVRTEGPIVLIHLMIAGRLRWLEPGTKLPAKITSAALDFDIGRLALTEASSRKRASLRLLGAEADLAPYRPQGVEPLEASYDEFAAAISLENRTVKRAMTSPGTVSGVGNAYSDEILFAAQISPLRLTSSLTDDEMARLYRATQSTLQAWIERLRLEFKDKFPGAGDVTAFRPDFNVHGRYREPCRVCGKPIQRIRYADKETNYCAQCQNEGRLLADRSLSLLLKKDWPKTLEQLEGERP